MPSDPSQKQRPPLFPLDPTFSSDPIPERITSDPQSVLELLKLQSQWAHLNIRILQHIGDMLSETLLPQTQPEAIRKLAITHWLDIIDAISIVIEIHISQISLCLEHPEPMSLNTTSASILNLASTHIPKMYTDLGILKAHYSSALREIGAKAGQTCISDDIYDNPAIQDEFEHYGDLLTPLEVLILRQESVEMQRIYFRQVVELYERLKVQQPDSTEWIATYRQLLDLTLEAKRSSYGLDTARGARLDKGARKYSPASQIDVSLVAPVHESESTRRQRSRDDSDLVTDLTILSGSRQLGGEAETAAERAHGDGEFGPAVPPTDSKPPHSSDESTTPEPRASPAPAQEAPLSDHRETIIPEIKATLLEEDATSQLARSREFAPIGATTTDHYLARPELYPQVDMQDDGEATDLRVEPQSASQGRRRGRRRYVELDYQNV